MRTSHSDYFRSLPAWTSDAVSKRNSGDTISLVLHTYTDDGLGITFPVQYIHRELIYRSPQQKDAVAFGVGRLFDSAEFQEVRVLFSRPNSTATLRGLVLEGEVKPA